MSTVMPMPTVTSDMDDVTMNGTMTEVTTALAHVMSPYDYKEYTISLEMYKPTVFTAFVVGVPMNLLSLAVMLRPNMRRTSSSVYFAALAVWDVFTLLSHLVTMVARLYERSMVSTVFCKLLFAIQSFVSINSNWTVALMTFERLLVVSFPLKAITWCTVKRAKVTLAVMTTISLMFNSHYMWTVHAWNQLCSYNVEKYGGFFEKWSFIESTVSPYIPIAVVIICNVLIFRRMRMASASQQKMTGGEVSRGRQSEGEEKQIKEATRAKKQMRQLTKMLMTVSVAFTVLNIPYAIFFVYLNVYPYREDMHVYAITALTSQCILVFLVCNHSLNFVLYCLTGQKFRHELMMMFGCARKKQKAGQVTGGQRPSTTGSTDVSMSQVNVSLKSNNSK